MKYFSIIDTFKCTLKVDKRHYLLLMLASAVASGIWLVTPVIDPLLNIKVRTSVEELFNQSENPQAFAQNIEQIAADTEARSNQRKPLSWLIWTAVYLCSLFLQLGLVKMALEIIQKGKTHFAVLFSQKETFGSVIVASIILGVALLAVVVATACVVGVVAESLALGMAAKGVLYLILLCLIAVGFAPFLMVRWIIVDKKLTGLSGLLASWELVKPLLPQVVATLLLVAPAYLLLSKLLEGFLVPFLKIVLPIKGLSLFLIPSLMAGAFLEPLMMLFMACLYESLLKIQKSL